MRFGTVGSGRSARCKWALICASIAVCAQPAAAQATLAIRGGKLYPDQRTADRAWSAGRRQREDRSGR